MMFWIGLAMILVPVAIGLWFVWWLEGAEGLKTIGIALGIASLFVSAIAGAVVMAASQADKPNAATAESPNQ